MSTPLARFNKVSAVAAIHKQQIKIVKPDTTAVVLRRCALLQDVDYFESQVGRLGKMVHEAVTLSESLTKMARSIRAEIELITK